MSPYGGAYAPPYAGVGNGYGGGYGSYGGAYGGGLNGSYGGYGGYGGSSYGAANSFGNGFGGNGVCGTGGFGGGFGGGGYGGGYGYPAFGGYSAQAPVGGGSVLPGGAGQTSPAAASAAGSAAAAAPQEAPPRIVANPLDNSLLIFANAQHYQSIAKMLKELDVPPRQILLEAKIYSIDLVDQFASGVSAALQAKSGKERRPLASLASGLTQFSAGTLVGQSRELLAFLQLQENVSHAHVISEPSLIATDSIPASINVGTQVPVATSSTTIPAGGNVAVSQSVSGVNTGVTLQVNARVNPSGVVTLIVNQEVSKPGGGASSLTPSFDQQVVQTQITTQDGDTIAIGGVISETTTSATSGIPLLSRIPFVGAAFGSHTYGHERTELILFMTPHVIYDTNDLLEASDQLKTQIKKLRKYLKD
jgi:general secretion pathway protein D